MNKKNFLVSKTIGVNLIALLIAILQTYQVDPEVITEITGQIPIWLPIVGIALRFATVKGVTLN
jgi:hypothetical protein